MKNEEASFDAAKRLLGAKNDIMARWEKTVRAEFNEAQRENKVHLLDSLPQFLDHLIDMLSKGKFNHEGQQKVVAVSQEHAEDRVKKTTYTIEHVIREYDILRKVIFAFLETEKALDVISRDIIFDVIQAAQTHSTCEFANLTFEKERKLRQQLEEKEAVFRTVFELAAAGKAIVDQSTGRFIQVNKRLCDMLGYTAQELLQKTTADITYPEDRALMINELPLVNPNDSLQGKIWNIEKRYLQKDGTPLWAMVSGAIFPASADQPQRVIATMFDISEKKQIENLKDQFINTLTHDLRTPLSVISMSAELLLLKKDDEQMKKKLVERIAANAERGQRMIQDLLDTSRIRSGHLISLDIEPCDLKQVIQESIETLAGLYGDRFIVSTRLEASSGYWSISGLRRIIENLCSNAVKYGTKNFPVLVTASEVGEKVSISVHNRGEPIPPENIESLFQQFSRSRSAQASGKLGWGIGLTIVKGITESHCGEVSVTSSIQDGTTFTVTLPRDARPCQAERLKHNS